MSALQLRIKNCLQTILDVQPSLRNIYRNNFAEDFKAIKAWLPRIDSMDLKEEDVVRLENVTTEFLREARYAGFHISRPGLH